MGYYMDMTYAVFHMKKENFGKALEALKAVFIPENMTCKDFVYGEERPHFSWVDTEKVLRSQLIEDALEAIRWDVGFNSNGDIDDIVFTGEKLGDDEIFFDAIAPYVEEGSYIEMHGETEDWRWVFTKNGLEEKRPHIIWE